MQILLTGFLNGKNARIFMSELWELLISAQDSLSGIPEKFLELKKEELKKKVVCKRCKLNNLALNQNCFRRKASSTKTLKSSCLTKNNSKQKK
jgi:PWI domain